MTDTTVPQAVSSEVSDPRVASAMLLGSYLEAGWGPNFSIGDSGTSFGPYQMHQGGALTSSGLTPQQAENVDLATRAMLPAYTAAANQVSSTLWQNNPEQAAEQTAFLAERPAQDYYATQGAGRVNQGWAATQAALGNPSSFTGNATFTSSQGTNATLTSSNLIPPWLEAIFPFLALTNANQSAKSLAERVGLVVFGALLIIVGILIVGLGTSTKILGSANQALGGVGTAKTRVGSISGSTQRAARASRDADVARRQGIANRSLAIGEKKVAIQASKERRLGGNVP